MNKLVTILLALVGFINFFPVLGVFGVSNLETAYNIDIPSADIALLLQHRALLFGILGGFVLYSLFRKQHQNVSMVLAGISMLGFVVLFKTVGNNNPAILKVLYFDYVGLFLLGAAVVIKFYAAKSQASLNP